MFSYQGRVRFDDVDHAGIVYYPRFLHFFHVVFEEFFVVKCGEDFYRDLLTQRRIGFPAVRTECDYRAPLKFGDRWRGDMSVSKLSNSAVTFAYEIIRENDDVLSAEGANITVCVNMDTMKSTQLPDDLRELFETIGRK